MNVVPFYLQRVNPALWRARTWRTVLLGTGRFKWYIDSVNGMDSNTGKSPAQAFQTIAGVCAVLSPGDSVGIRRGSVFYEKFPIAAGCKLAAYGNGARPIFECRDALAAGELSKTGGLTNVYQAAIAFDAGLVDSPEVHVWENGVPYAKVANTATCDATPGSYYIASSSTSPQTLYIHAYGSTDPTADGKARLRSARALGIGATDTDNVTVRDMHVIGNLRGDGGVVLGENATLVNCVLEWGSKHNALVGQGSRVVNCFFYDTLYSGASTALVVNEDTPDGAGALIEGCIFEQRTVFPHSQNASPINGHYNVSGSFGTITIQDCTFTGYDIALLAMNHCDNLWIIDCDFVSCKYGYKCLAGVATRVVRGTWTGGAASQRIINQDISGAGGTLRFEGTVFTPGGVSSAIGYFSLAQVCTIEMVGCTLDISLVTTSTRYGVYTGNTGADITWTGCRFIGDLGAGGLWVYLSTIPTVWEADNNEYDTPNARWRIGANTYNTLGDYQAAAAPNEAHSVTI